MKNTTNLSRRGFFKKASLGLAGTMATGTALAQVCKPATGAQGLGPFFPRPGTPVDEIMEDGSQPIYLANDNDLTFINGRDGKATGQEVVVKGVLTNDKCEPIPNATIIIWQASKTGRYNHTGDAVNENFLHPVTGEMIERKLDPFFQSWGQTTTNADGEYEFRTIVPGFYPADVDDGWYRPPHIHFLVSATGYEQFVTQMYFRGDAIDDNEFIQELNAKDLLLQGDNLTEAQRENLIVDFELSDLMDPAMHGEFNIALSR